MKSGRRSLADEIKKVQKLIAVTQQLKKESAQSYELKMFKLMTQANAQGITLTEQQAKTMLSGAPMTPEQFQAAIKDPAFRKKHMASSPFTIAFSLLLLYVVPNPLKLHVMENIISKFDKLPNAVVTGIYMLLYPLMLHVNPRALIIPIVKQLINFAVEKCQIHLSSAELQILLLSLYMTTQELLSQNIVDHVLEAQIDNVADSVFTNDFSYGPMIYAPMAVGILAYRHGREIKECAKNFFSGWNKPTA